MSKSVLYVVIGVLVIALGVVGYMYMQERNTHSVSIDMGKSGITLKSN